MTKFTDDGGGDINTRAEKKENVVGLASVIFPRRVGMSDSTVRGRFVWHELMTTDTKSAASFFAKAIGWKTQVSPRDPSYTIFAAAGRPRAGLMVLPAAAKAMGAPPSWLTYIGSPNVDETAQQAPSLGGKVLKAPADIPTIGRFAVVQDPQGAVFAAFTPLGGPAADAEPAIGDFSWHELITTDWRAALTFYQRLFGWDATSAMDMGPEIGTYQMFGRNGRPMGGMFNKPSQAPGPAMWLPYVRVQDSKKVAAAVPKLGGKIINGPMEVPGGDWIATGLDLQGAMFAVHSLKPAVKKMAAKKTAAKAKVVTAKAAKTTKTAKAKPKAAAAKQAAKGKAARPKRSLKKARRPAKKRR